MISRDDGVATARIVLVGEAYGKNEAEANRPFVGSSYTDKLLPWWRDVGLDRSMFYITNVWDQGQPDRIDGIPEYEMRQAMERCRRRVDLLVGPEGRGPVVIVTTGNYALYTFTGQGRVSFHYKDGRHERPGIKDWRGSILSYQTNDGRQIKVIPTVHPAYTFSFKEPELEWVCRKDWERIANDAKFYDLKLPSFTKMIAPSEGEVREWIAWTRGEADKRKHLEKFTGRLACSADVETPYKAEYTTVQEASKSVAPTLKCGGCGHTRRWHLPDPGDFACMGLRGKGGCVCLGFSAPMMKPKRVKVSEDAYMGCNGYAWRPDLAICVPTTIEFWRDPEVFDRVMGYLRDFHADPNVDFGGQNFAFDAWWYAIYKMPLHHIAWDLMKMHRVQRSWSAWHDLGFQASIDTRHPYWKHEAKLPGEISQWSHNKEQLWAYNCSDNWVQLTLLYARIQALASRGRLEYYMEMESPMDDELLPMSLHGIRADEPGRHAEFEKLTEEAKVLSGELNTAAGMPIVGVHKKSGAIIGKIPSPAKLKVFLYDKHKLPLQYRKSTKRGEGKKVSTDVVAIRRCMEAFPGNTELQTVGRMVLRHRRLMKKSSDLKESRVEADGRVYAIFKQDTLLGRLSSSSTPKDEGQNLQNVDNELRKFYLADTGDETPH